MTSEEFIKLFGEYRRLDGKLAQSVSIINHICRDAVHKKLLSAYDEFFADQESLDWLE